jgi:hypothetical protein
MEKIVREKSTRAILNKDETALSRYKKARARLRMKDNEISDMKVRLERLEKLLLKE